MFSFDDEVEFMRFFVLLGIFLLGLVTFRYYFGPPDELRVTFRAPISRVIIHYQYHPTSSGEDPNDYSFDPTAYACEPDAVGEGQWCLDDGKVVHLTGGRGTVADVERITSR